MSTTAAKIREFYEQHNPAKLPDLPALLHKYAGKHKKLLASLRKKYKVPVAKKGAPPAPADTATNGGDPTNSNNDKSSDNDEVKSRKTKASSTHDENEDEQPQPKKVKKTASSATVFCCVKCGHDVVEVKKPIRIGSLKRRGSDKSAVVPEKELLKKLAAVAGTVRELHREGGGVERQYIILCGHCSHPIGYRHKPLSAPADFFYITRGTIVSSTSTHIGGATSSSDGIPLAVTEQSSTLVCHVTPGTKKACITEIDEDDEVWWP